MRFWYAQHMRKSLLDDTLSSLMMTTPLFLPLLSPAVSDFPDRPERKIMHRKERQQAEDFLRHVSYDARNVYCCCFHSRSFYWLLCITLLFNVIKCASVAFLSPKIVPVCKTAWDDIAGVLLPRLLGCIPKNIICIIFHGQ